ncbi:MAG: PAP2 superfamily protein [bacterium ADurb.Bin270]|nr:MAG: PAP2 superfamily protein [bacterium ADurb.Bin270]
MTHVELREKRFWFAIMLAYFGIGYMATNWIASIGSRFYDFGMSFENSIPFVPVFILGYACVYGGVFLAYAIIDDIEDWRRAVITFFTATTICYAFFLFMPVKMTMRPPVESLTGIYGAITSAIFAIDLPYNCFPSLHVTYPVFITLVSWRNHRVMRWVMLAMAIIVAVSVVLVKQHYIADAVAGIFTALFSYLFALKTEKFWFRSKNAATCKT